jgi:hypothetical protein
MVWEMTWPEARVIEPAYIDPRIEDELSSEPDDAPAEYTDDESTDDESTDDESTDEESSSEPDDSYAVYISLRPTCLLSTWRQTPLCDRVREDEVLGRSPDPIALHVCRESRTHTLRHYICLQHYSLDNCAFYVHPGRDALWLTAHVTKSPDHLSRLQYQYGRQLGKIQRMLVEVHDWLFMDASIALSSFWAVREIEIHLDVDGVPPGEEKIFWGALDKLQRRNMCGYRGWGLTIQYMDRTSTTHSRIMTGEGAVAGSARVRKGL